MITTEHYRDVIHIARHQRPQHYSIMQEVPWQDRPLVRRRYRKVVRERVTPPRGAVKAALDEARQSLRNIKAVDVVSTGLRGENLDEWRALVRISFLVERVSE